MSTSEDFNIILGVQLEDGWKENIRKQLNKAGDFEIDVDINLKKNALSKIESETIKANVGVNKTYFKSELREAVKSDEIKANIGVNKNHFASEFKTKVKDYIKNYKGTPLIKVGVDFDEDEIIEIKNRIEKQIANLSLNIDKLVVDTIVAENIISRDGKVTTEEVVADRVTTKDNRVFTEEVVTDRVTTRDGKVDVEEVVTDRVTTRDGKVTTEEVVADRATTKDGKVTVEEVTTDRVTTKDGKVTTEELVADRVATRDGKVDVEEVVTDRVTARDGKVTVDTVGANKVVVKDNIDVTANVGRVETNKVPEIEVVGRIIDVDGNIIDEKGAISRPSRWTEDENGRWRTIKEGVGGQVRSTSIQHANETFDEMIARHLNGSLRLAATPENIMGLFDNAVALEKQLAKIDRNVSPRKAAEIEAQISRSLAEYDSLYAEYVRSWEEEVEELKGKADKAQRDSEHAKKDDAVKQEKKESLASKADKAQKKYKDKENERHRLDTHLNRSVLRASEELSMYDTAEQDAKALEERNRKFKEYTSLLQKASSLTRERNELVAKGDKDGQLAGVEKTLADVRGKLKEAKGAIDFEFNEEEAMEYRNILDDILEKANKSKGKVVDIKFKADAKQLEAARKAIDSYGDNGNATTHLMGLKSDLENMAHPSKAAKDAVAQHAQAYNNLGKAIIEYNAVSERSDATEAEKVAAARKVAAAKEDEKRAYEEATQAIKQNKIASKNDEFLSNQKSMLLKMDVWEKKNSKVMSSNSRDARKLAQEFVELRARIEACSNAGDFKNLSRQFSDLNKKVQKAGFDGLSAIDKLKNKFREYASYAAASMGIMEVIQGLRQMATEVLEVDTAMTGLLRVTEMTSSETEVMFDKMVSSAKEYGRTLTDTINATADWVRAGFDENTALGLAEVTAMYQNVSDLDYDEAAENLLTSYNGFKEQLSNDYGGDTVAAVEHITDVLNELDNEFSVTSAGLGEGLSRSASALQLAKNTFEESAAMIGAVTEVTQDPEKAGNAMKILSLRLRGMKGQLEELGEETDENVENISKMQGQILNMTKGEVNIFDANGDFKSTYEIMEGIARVWDDLSSIDQANLLETIAGKHRANDVAALIENWDRAAAMAETGLNSAGSAAKENERTVNSLQGRINALTAAWQEFANAAMNSDFLKGLVSGATAALEVITKLVDTVGTLPTLIAAAMAAMSLTSFKNMLPTQVIADKDAYGGKKTSFELGKSLKSTFNKEEGSFSLGRGYANQLKTDSVLIQNYRNALISGRDATQALNDIQAKGSATCIQYASGMDSVTEKGRKAAETQRDFTAASQKAEIVNRAQNKSLSNVKNMLAGYNQIASKSEKEAAKYANACRDGNIALGNYLKGLDGAKAGMGGYIGALVKTKIAMIGVELQAMVMNAALTIGLSLAINALTKLFDVLIVTKEEYAEMAQEALDAFEEQNKAAKNAKKTVDDLGDSYIKLSKGVNQTTGENISLSNDEYEEYLDITNQIAEAIPSLVKGYDSQGNAILSCAGDVNALTEAYKEMQKAANDALLNDAGSVFETFKNEATKLSGKGLKDSWLWDFDSDMDMESYETLSNLSSNLSDVNLELQSTLSNLSEYAGASGLLLNGLTGGLSSALSAATYDFADSYHEIATAFANLGYEQNLFETNGDFVARILKEDPNVAKKALKAFEATIEPVADGMRDVAEAHISNAFLSGDYDNISSSMQTMIESMVPNLSFDFFSSFIGADGSFNTMGFYAELDSIMETFNNLDPFQEKQFKVFMDLQTQYNSGEISAGEYFSKIEDMNSLISTLDPEVQESIKIVLGLDDASVNEIKNDYNSLINSLVDSGMALDAAKEFADSLNSTELTAAVELIASGDINLEGIDLEKFRAELEHITKLKEALNYTINIEAETESIESLNTALEETISATGLTSESITKLKGRYAQLESFDPASLFERTSSGIRLNYEELSRLEDEYGKFNKQQTDETLSTLVNEYNDLTSQIDSCSDATERQNLLNEQDNIYNKIEEVYNLSSAYDALTSSINGYLNAQTTEDATSLYSQIGEDYETIKNDLASGWFSQADKAYIQMFSFEDLSGASYDEYMAVFDKIDDRIAGTSYSWKNMWKFDDDGNIQVDGLYNFLEATEQLNSEWASFDEATKTWDLNFDVEAMAKEFGVSTDMIEMFIQQLETSLGFEIDYGSMAEQLGMVESEFEGLVSEAQKANDALKKLELTDTTFNFETTDINSLTSDLDEALVILEGFKDPVTGELNMDAEGAKEALTVAQTLTSLIDNLGNAEPAYLKLDASQVDDDIKEPLESLKQYDELVEKKHQLQLEGADVSEIDAQLLEIATNLSKLSDETKIKLGIDGLTPEEIQQKIESGEINVDGTVNLEANMDESLSQMLDLMMVEHGFMSEVEFTQKWVINTETETKGDAPSMPEVNQDSLIAKLLSNVKEGASGAWGSAKESFIDFGIKAKDWLNESWDSAVETVSGWGNSIGNTASETWDSAKNGFINFGISAKEWLNESWDTASETVSGWGTSIGSWVSNTWDSAKNGFIDFGVKAKEWLNESWDTAVETVKGWGTSISGAISDAFNAFKESEIGQSLSGLWKSVSGFGSAASKFFAREFGEIWDSVKNSFIDFGINAKEWLNEAWNSAVETVSGWGNSIGNKVSEIWDSAKNAFIDFGIKAKDWLNESWDSVAGTVSGWGTSIGNWISNTWDSAKNGFINFGIKAKDWLNEAWDTAVEAISDFTAPIAEKISGAFDSIKDTVLGWGDSLSNWISEAWNTAVENTTNFGETLAQFFSEAWDYVKETVSGWGDSLSEGTGNLWDGIVEKVSGLKDAISGAISDALDGISDWFNKLADVFKDSDSFEELFSNIGDLISESLGGIKDKVTEKFTEIKEEVSNFFKGIFSGESIGNKTIELVAKVFGIEDVDSLKEKIQGIIDKIVDVGAYVFGGQLVQDLINFIKGLFGKTVDAGANVFGGEALQNLIDLIKDLFGKVVEVGANVFGEDKVDALKTAISGIKDKTVQIGAKIKEGATGIVNAAKSWLNIADGTAHANGTAFAEGTVGKSGKAFKRGNWGIKGSGTALVGELGQELVVRNGRFFTVGDNGAEFFKYQPNDIVFNAGQTKQLFEQGKIVNGKTRGRAVAGGTAFAEGNAFGFGSLLGKVATTVTGSGRGRPSRYSSGGSSSSSSGSSSSSDSSSSSASEASKVADEFLEKMDWIEVAIDRIERAISRLDLVASSAFKNWTTRNSALVKQMGKVREEIDIQTRGAARYLEEANSIGLSEEYKKKVQNGEIDIEKITDEDLKEKIDEYQQWYEKHLDCIEAAEELKETLSELYAQKFDNIITEFEGILSVAEHTNNMLEEAISQSEAKGRITSTSYYDALIAYEEDKQKTLTEQRDRMLAQLNENVASGAIEVGSEEWVNEVTAINDVTLALEESETAVLDYAKTIRELEWEQFEALQDRISHITEETEFLIDLMSNDKLYDDNGQLTNEGMATMGLHGVNYNTNMHQADMYGEEAQKAYAAWQADPANKELEDHYYEMLELQREHISLAEGEKEAIRDMVEEGINIELDALQERIDAYNEALDSQKEMYDYQKKVAEQTKEIADLEKQMAAYSGDDSEEARAKIQELKISLEEANAELEETEYDKYISDQQSLLDELYTQYEEILNERLDNIELLMNSMIDAINGDSGSIKSTLEEKANSVGTSISNEMKTIWGTDSANGNNVTKAIASYGDKFDKTLTGVKTAIDGIKTYTDSLIKTVDEEAEDDINNAKNSNAANTPEASGGVNNSQNTTPDPPSQNDTPKNNTDTPAEKTISVGGKINAGSARIYSNSSGGGGGSQYFKSDPIYTVLKEQNGYLQVRHHKLSSGVTGWFKKSDVKAYATGRKNFLSDEVAWTQEAGREFIIRPSDGAVLTPLAKGDSVLNAAASSNLWNMANSPAEFIRDNLSLSGANVHNGSGGQTNVEQNFEKIEIILPNVTNYDEFKRAMQKDKDVERFLHAATVDQLAGKSPMRKRKSIR